MDHRHALEGPLSNAPETSLTAKDLLKIFGDFKTKFPNPPLVGIVARPEHVEMLRHVIDEAKPKPTEFPIGLLAIAPLIPVFPDPLQAEPWRLFFDDKVLRDYLKRNNEPSIDNEKPKDPT